MSIRGVVTTRHVLRHASLIVREFGQLRLRARPDVQPPNRVEPNMSRRIVPSAGPRTGLDLCRGRSRSAFPITDTELKLIAALAIVGESGRPRAEYRTPAATGTPSTSYANAHNRLCVM